MRDLARGKEFSAAAFLLTAASLLPALAGAQVVTTVAGSGELGSADGTGTAASFWWPEGVVADARGNLYVADSGCNKIRKILPGGVVTTLAGSGYSGSTDGTGAAATFFYPRGVAVDGAGNVYVTDSGSRKIRKVSAGGVVTTLAGTGMHGNIDGPAAEATFAAPTGIAVDAAGNLYVANTATDTIRKITPSGTVSTLAGSGEKGSADGKGTAATFRSPYGLALDAEGNVYVADHGNEKIRKVAPDGLVTTFAGSGVTGGADGTGTSASFSTPFGMAVDASGNVYVADAGNNKIRKISPEGVVTTFAGSGNCGSADGTGAAAAFNGPSGLAVDGAGNFWVADTWNSRIRKIATSAAGCVPDAATACLVGGRYKVTSHWRNQYAGGQVAALSAARLTDTTAAFWLSDGTLYEYLIRINTATDNGKAWISIPTFTDVEFWIAVTDTVRGQYTEYHSPAGNRTMLYDPDFFVFP
ncbi:MAG TPA: NHL repeat-containing protein [Thermoanaerobaculia bacterium]|nr:NHL repeat-containing protein [Thermoanaerobaculia bacterium]